MIITAFNSCIVLKSKMTDCQHCTGSREESKSPMFTLCVFVKRSVSLYIPGFIAGEVDHNRFAAGFRSHVGNGEQT